MNLINQSTHLLGNVGVIAVEGPYGLTVYDIAISDGSSLVVD